MLLISHVCNSVSRLSFVILLLSADRKRLRINQPRENSPHHSAKMYSPSVAFNYAPSEKGYQRNLTPSSLPSLSSSRTCVRSRFMHGIISFRILKRVVQHRMTSLA
jgi:hypothetical protein